MSSEHPCLANTNPVSRIQPKITSKLKWLPVAELPPDYPWHIAPLSNGRFKIPYWLFSDCGPPSANLDVGTPGDVYLDLTPGAHALYGKTADGQWTRWSDTNASLGWKRQWPQSEWIVNHPHLPNRALWVTIALSGPNGTISWYRGTSSALQSRRAVYERGLAKDTTCKSVETIQSEAAAILVYLLDGGASKSKKVSERPSAPEASSLKRAASPDVSGPKKKKAKSEPKVEAPVEDSDDDLGPFSIRF
ncbi:hypothetical protein FB45DRAFT_1068360 [Roridomyces roridus]|uniref:Uncharacterized protein n=1 Tax=Roridomyces roridus TaxID=1738132 RepID=A0AAD7B0C2_9AGAR|nr:hypothetical protein FB45DRAFT_1068360 [Roridomyces roridus]